MTTVVSEQAEIDPGILLEPAPGNRLVPLAVWLVAIIVLSLIPLKVVSFGYLPIDDALRHAAKAVDGRPWSEILVLRPEFQSDHNPGWHWVLGQVHRWTKLEPDGLVVSSVVGLFLLTLAAPMAGLKRPEAWLGALCISTLTFPIVEGRVFLGRPLAVTIAITLFILLLWQRAGDRRRGWPTLICTTAMLAVSAWVHGSWYLFGLVVFAYVLAGQFTGAAWLGGCWVAGSFLGAALTGHPITFLANAVRIVLNCFSGEALPRMLALEFWPSDGNVLAPMTVGVFLLWRYVTGRWDWRCVNNPIFLLAVIGWILGLRVSRFYADWGAPALLLWVALELSEHFEVLLSYASPRRLLVAGGIGVSLFLMATADLNGRWTNALFVEFLSENDPEMRPWLPDDGGILYSSDMTVFYQTYYKNPHAKWRYMLGFEPTFMPPEDLKIYRNIQMNLGSYKAYEPWVNKMRPEDRLVLRSGSPTPPNIPGLEWHYTARELWVGRKPKTTPASVDKPAAGKA